MRRRSAVLFVGLLALSLPLAAFQLTPLDDETLAVKLETRGPTREAAIKKAKLDAVRAATGRVLLSDQLILADELLVKYLNNYGENFVSAVEVLSEEFTGGENRIEARVFVNYQSLIDDLDSKKFLYKPAYKPKFETFLTETLDGQISTEGNARSTLSIALDQQGMLPYENQILNPPTTTDVADDEFFLRQAIISSQRAGVELIVSGESSSRLLEKKKLYYDDYWFYRTDMDAKLIRVDTGEVLFETEAFGTAGSRNLESAMNQSIEKAAEKIARDMVAEYVKFWPIVVQREGDYEVLLTGVDDETMRLVSQNVERLGNGVQVRVRKSFDRTAVLSIVFSGQKEELIRNLHSCPYPTLSVLNPDAERAFEVQVGS